jgi:hypothetical protein
MYATTANEIDSENPDEAIGNVSGERAARRVEGT